MCRSTLSFALAAVHAASPRLDFYELINVLTAVLHPLLTTSFLRRANIISFALIALARSPSL